MDRPSLLRPTDDEARALARSLLLGARHGALGVLHAGGPMVTRVAVGHDGRSPLLLLSALALHSRALAANPAVSLLVGEPGPRGDPLAHSRLTLLGRVEPGDKAALRDLWLRDHPKAGLYYDLGDFAPWRLAVTAAHLNGGFGRAFALTPQDLGQDPGQDPGEPP